MRNTYLIKHITFSELEEAEQKVVNHPKYGLEQQLIEHIISMHTKNDDLRWIAIKVSVIDLTNSTQLTNYKNKLSLYDIAKILLEIPNLDEDIMSGHVDIVNEIARRCKEYQNDGVNLFSFASKYCCYHNIFAYHRDDFSIFDSVLSEHLCEFPTSRHRIKKGQPEKWRCAIDYEAYNNYIGDILDDNNIHEDGRRRMFDHLVWNQYRPSNGDNNKQ